MLGSFAASLSSPSLCVGLTLRQPLPVLCKVAPSSPGVLPTQQPQGKESLLVRGLSESLGLTQFGNSFH